MRAFSLSLGAYDWLLHVRFLADGTGRRVLVDGYHFTSARSFVRGWMLPRPPKLEKDVSTWRGRWPSGTCEVSCRHGTLNCRLTIFRCFRLSVFAMVEQVGDWLLGGAATLEELSVPGWPEELASTVAVVAELSPLVAAPSVLLVGGDLRLGVSRGESAAGCGELENVRLQPLRLTECANVRKMARIAQLGSALGK